MAFGYTDWGKMRDRRREERLREVYADRPDLVQPEQAPGILDRVGGMLSGNQQPRQAALPAPGTQAPQAPQTMQPGLPTTAQDNTALPVAPADTGVPAKKPGWTLQPPPVDTVVPPPDRINMGLPAAQSPFKPASKAEWDRWQAELHKYSGANTPEERLAIDNMVGLYKQQNFQKLWSQGVDLWQRNQPAEASQALQAAYSYFTNGMSAMIKYDPKTNRMLALPYSEEMQVGGKPMTFDLQEAMQIPNQLGPAAFGRYSEGAEAAWGGEQRAREMQPWDIATKQEAIAGSQSRRKYQDLLSEEKSIDVTEKKYQKQALDSVRSGVKDWLEKSADEIREMIDDPNLTDEDVDTLRDLQIGEEIDAYMRLVFPNKIGDARMEAEQNLLKQEIKSELTGGAKSKSGGKGPGFEDMDTAQEAETTFTTTWDAKAGEEGGADADPKKQRVYRQTGPIKDQLLDLAMVLAEERLGRGSDKASYSAIIDFLVDALTEPGSIKQHMGKDWLAETPGGQKYRISKGDYYIQTQKYPTPRPISEPTKRMFDNVIGPINKQALPTQGRYEPQGERLPALPGIPTSTFGGL